MSLRKLFLKNGGENTRGIEVNFNFLVFSSPEHKVLRVSYCDRSLSVVRRASSVNFFT